MSTFSIDNFWKFCSALRVDTKDRGTITLSPDNLYGCQRYFVEQIVKGFNDGIHSFVVLKGRQLGITTISLALDLYWLFSRSGMHGSLVTHDEESRDMFKSTLSMYIEGLPKQFKVPIEQHNRAQLVARNRSRVSYQVAGTRKNSSLGKGKGLTFLHSTETSAYGDAEGLASLRSALAEDHPDRLFIYESTAQGFNHFHDMWERAENSTSERAIFIGWWLKESYAKGPDTPQWEVYYDKGRRTLDEARWIKEVKQAYGWEITDAQLVWWRWKLNEEIGDIDHMMQNFPPTEKHAFIASGSNFFNNARIADEIREARKVKPDIYRFVLRESFEDSDVVESTGRTGNLWIWEYPKPGALYAIGADPAFGSSEWADRFACSVWRCYADGMEQVAEFCTADCSTYQFAWVILYLAGAYTTLGVDDKGRVTNGAMLNLEINGPGQAVWQEMLNMRRHASANPKGDVSRKIMMVVNNIQNYLYKRVDSFGRPSAYHWKSTYDTKERMFNIYRDCFERGISIVRSPYLLEEMTGIVRDEGSIEGPGRKKDDRVVAATLAHVAWADFVRNQAISKQLMMPKRGGEDAMEQKQQGFHPQIVGYLKRLGVKAA